MACNHTIHVCMYIYLEHSQITIVALQCFLGCMALLSVSYDELQLANSTVRDYVQDTSVCSLRICTDMSQ